MTHQVTLDLPDAVYQYAAQVASTQGQPLETVLISALTDYWLAASVVDEGLETDAEKRAYIAPAIEAADWWNTDGDKEWDEWQP